MNARLAFVILTIACVALDITRARVDGLTLLAIIFALAAVAARAPQRKATKK